MPVTQRRTQSPSASNGRSKKFSWSTGDDPSDKRKPARSTTYNTHNHSSNTNHRTYVIRYRWKDIIDFWFHRHRHSNVDCPCQSFHHSFQSLFQPMDNISSLPSSFMTHPKRKRRRRMVLLLLISICMFMTLHSLFPTFIQSTKTKDTRPIYVPILIHATTISHNHILFQSTLEYNQTHSQSSPPPFPSSRASRQRIFQLQSIHPKTTAPNYDGLHLTFLGEDTMIRTIQTALSEYLYGDTGHVYTQNDYRNRSKHHNDDYVEPYYAFDDDNIRSTATAVQSSRNHCRRTSWHRLFFPTCNDLHTLQLTTGDSTFLSYGSYRQVFQINHQQQQQGIENQNDEKEPLILKMNSFMLDFEYDKYEFIRMDALVMERLTSSPRIANLYGHCGASVLTENLPIEVEENVVPNGYIHTSELQDKDDVQPQNTFTPSEKLDMALRMAEALADLHGFKDGIIVHDDIQLCQYLYKSDNKTMKLNDFNRAEIMLYDEFTNQYCPYLNGQGGGNWRAPEEYVDGPLTESIDTWSLGNNFYSLLTGLWVYPDDQDMSVMRDKIINGTLTSIDSRYKTHSFAEGKLVEIIQRIWEYNPRKRPSIFEIVQFLREAVEMNSKLI